MTHNRMPMYSRKIGDEFYYNIWKTLSNGTKLEIIIKGHVYTCEVVGRKGQDKYRLKILKKRRFKFEKVKILPNVEVDEKLLGKSAKG